MGGLMIPDGISDIRCHVCGKTESPDERINRISYKGIRPHTSCIALQI